MPVRTYCCLAFCPNSSLCFKVVGFFPHEFMKASAVYNHLTSVGSDKSVESLEEVLHLE